MREHERSGGGFREHRSRIAGDRDDRNADTLEVIDHRLELGGLATLRYQNRDVAFRGHAEIAVDRFRQVQERCGRAGRGEGRRNLAADMARLAETADNQLAWTVQDQADRLLERRAEAF